MGGWGARALTSVSIQRLRTGRPDRADLLSTFHTLSLLFTTVTVRVLGIPVSGLVRPRQSKSENTGSKTRSQFDAQNLGTVFGDRVPLPGVATCSVWLTIAYETQAH